MENLENRMVVEARDQMLNEKPYQEDWQDVMNDIDNDPIVADAVKKCGYDSLEDLASFITNEATTEELQYLRDDLAEEPYIKPLKFEDRDTIASMTEKVDRFVLKIWKTYQQWLVDKAKATSKSAYEAKNQLYKAKSELPDRFSATLENASENGIRKAQEDAIKQISDEADKRPY